MPTDATPLADVDGIHRNLWPQIEPVLGHLFIEEVDTSAMDALKRALPANLGPKSVNNRLALVRAVLRFCWKRGHLVAIPYIPTERAPKKKPIWYSEKERDRFLAGMFELQPQWYLFFYLSARLGLRVSEVYAISRSRLRDIPPQLIVDRAVQRGTKEAYVLELTEDILGAIRWHARQGYAGPEFLLSKDGTFPRYIDSYKRPTVAVQ